MTLIQRKTSIKNTPMQSEKDISVSSKPYRRCRQAFTAVYFTRILTSLAQKVLHERLRILGRSPSYIALNMEPLENPNEPDPLFFAIDRDTLVRVVRDRDFELVSQLGGARQLALALESDSETGISSEATEIERRVDVFGANGYEKPPRKRFLGFVVDALKDVTVLILLGCAVLSLGFGIKQHGLEDGWYDGGSIVIAIVLVVAVSACSNFKQSRQFDKLSDESGNIEVEVVRDGRRQRVSIFEVVVGDVVCLKIGDQVPADGLFLDGYSLKLDESSMTGESDHVAVNDTENPFLLSGTKVTDGYSSMLVTSVGMNTLWGEMMSSISRDLDEETPLQARLNKLTSQIGRVGLLVAFLVLVVMLIRYFTGHTTDESGHSEFRGKKTEAEAIINSILSIVSAAVTIVVVAIPEGLPLAVTLTLAYSMKRMMADNAMVRKLSACETMGSATTICTDKTGTLTLNQMKVTEFWIGKELVKAGDLFDKATRVRNLLQEGAGLNTTGSVFCSDPSSAPEISGSPTEKAILSWAVSDLGMVMEEIKLGFEILNVEAFNSEKKRSGIAARRKEDGCIRVHWKGAAEMIVAMCSSYYDQTGMMQEIDDDERRKLVEIIQGMAAKSLRCIAFAHRVGGNLDDESEMALTGIVGLKDPCRPGVREAVESCRNAGVDVKMVTGDNVFTARAIAIECGILEDSDDTNGEAVVEGKDFRSYSNEERMARVEKIRVMARSSPFDKLLMVRCLKQRGHVVAVTGDGTNDAPALKEADIGLSMGVQGTEVAKESSDIVILDDNFASVVTVARWGRCVYSNIQKFIQFQLTVNAAALVINFVAAVSSGNIPLTAVQLLWVNLIMDTLGALALATEQPTNGLMKKPPVGRSEPLMTRVMWRNLTVQAVYQVAVLLTLQFKGKAIFGVDERVKDTLIFNCFVFCQVFNEFNARELEKKNIFQGILKSKLFLGIVGVTVVLQVIMVEFLKRFANTERLNWGQWGACIGIAIVSWPIGWLAKCIPVSWLDLPFLARRSNHPQ